MNDKFAKGCPANRRAPLAFASNSSRNPKKGGNPIVPYQDGLNDVKKFLKQLAEAVDKATGRSDGALYRVLEEVKAPRSKNSRITTFFGSSTTIIGVRETTILTIEIDLYPWS